MWLCVNNFIKTGGGPDWASVWTILKISLACWVPLDLVNGETLARSKRESGEKVDICMVQAPKGSLQPGYILQAKAHLTSRISPQAPLLSPGPCDNFLPHPFKPRLVTENALFLMVPDILPRTVPLLNCSLDDPL